jgi:hypothetical protein
MPATTLRTLLVGAGLAVATGALVAASARSVRQTPTAFDAYLLDPARETALARSAAPEAISASAGLYLLRATGHYELVASSKNGFNCLVQRSFTVPTTDPAQFYDPRVLAPICFSREASATVMQRDLFIAPLVAAGVSNAEIRRREAAAYADGTLHYPDRAVIAYMFSSGHWLGPNVEHWFPHVMIWAPNVTPEDLAPADIGRFGVHTGLPILDARYGPRQMLIAIPVPHAISPAGG